MLLTLVLTIGAGATGHAWDDDDPDDVVVKEPQYILSDQQFDQLLFRGNTIEVVAGQRRVTSLEYARQRMEIILTGEIERVAGVCSLTETQKKKLQLAGSGDIVRYRDQVADLRRKYTKVSLGRQQYLEVRNELQALSLAPQFITFQGTSLFQKTLRKTLNDEQLVKYHLLARERQVSVVESALATWSRSSNGVKLAGETRQKFIDTLVNHGQIPQSSNPYGQYIVLFEAARLENLVKPLLNETEWNTIEAQVAAARRLEPTIRKSGQWPVPPDDDEEDTQSDATKD